MTTREYSERETDCFFLPIISSDSPFRDSRELYYSTLTGAKMSKLNIFAIVLKEMLYASSVAIEHALEQEIGRSYVRLL